MAKVEMDLSEFKRMEQTEIDLRTSLKKEDELNKEIIRLKEENLATMKANEKSVTIVRREEIYETAIQTVSNEQIDHYISSRIRGYVEHVNSDGRLGRIPYNILRDMRSMGLDSFSLSEKFFKKERHRIRPQSGEIPETVTYKGLDQVREDIRKDELENIDLEIKSKLSALDKESKKVKELQSENKSLKDAVKTLEADSALNNEMLSTSNLEIERMSKEIVALNKNHKDLIEFNEGFASKSEKTQNILTQFSLFNFKSSLKNLKEIWMKN